MDGVCWWLLAHTLYLWSLVFHPHFIPLCLSHSFLSVKVLQPKSRILTKKLLIVTILRSPFFIHLQEGKCEDSGKFAMEFASHAYSALELSDSYVRFLSSVSRRRRCSSSRAVPSLSIRAWDEGFVTKIKRNPWEFQSCRRLWSSKNLSRKHLSLRFGHDAVVAEPNFRSGTLFLWKLMLNSKMLQQQQQLRTWSSARSSSSSSCDRKCNRKLAAQKTLGWRINRLMGQWSVRAIFPSFSQVCYCGLVMGFRILDLSFLLQAGCWGRTLIYPLLLLQLDNYSYVEKLMSSLLVALQCDQMSIHLILVQIHHVIPQYYPLKEFQEMLRLLLLLQQLPTSW